MNIVHHRSQVLLPKALEWMLCAIVFLLPFQTRWVTTTGTLNGGPWEYGTVSLYGLDILIILFFCVWIGYVVMQKKHIRLSLSHVLALLLLLIALFSMAFAANKINALFWWWKLAEGIVLMIVVSHCSFNKQRVIIAWIISAVLQSIFALIQFFSQQVVGIRWLGISTQHPDTYGVQVIESAVGRTLRSYGSLPHPNILAGFLVIAIILCFVLCITHEQKNRRNMYALLVLLLLSSGLWTTFSRQAWIALAIVLCGILLHTFFVKRIFSPVAIIATLSVVIPMSVLSLLYPHLLESRIHMNTRLEQWSVTEREHYMHQSVDIVRNHWATGVGMGNYTAFIHSQDKQHNIIKPGTTYQPVHNIYLLIFSELGIFGLSALVLLLLSVGIHIQKQNPYSMAWGMSIIALLIIGFFDHYLWSLHIGLLLFWITLGFSESRS